MNSVVITFTNDWIAGDEITMSLNYYETSYVWTWVTTRSGAQEVTVGTPTATAGETAAINFKAALDIDISAGYTITQTGNQVTITATVEDEVFNYVAVTGGQGTATLVYGDLAVLSERKINVRSPFFVSVSDTDLTKATLDIYIYTGLSSDSIDGNTYSLSNTAINENVTFEISHLISDYLDINFNGSYSSRVVWANVTLSKYVNDIKTTSNVTRYLAFDGYGYFEEGVNPTLSEGLLQSNNTMYVMDNNYFYIPIQQDNLAQVDLKADGVIVDTQTFTATTDSDDVIRYVGFTNESVCDGVVNYLFEDDSDFLFEDGSVFVFNTPITPSDIIDEILITYDDATTESVYVKTITENKHTPYRLTFINKFGALQSVWMFKRSDLTLDIERDEYRSYTFNSSTSSYDTADHQYRNLYVSGKQSLRLNSGFYPESYNKIFRELLLSEKVWIHYESNLLPVNITSDNLSFKTSLNDKLINYTIELDFAFDTINSIY